MLIPLGKETFVKTQFLGSFSDLTFFCLNRYLIVTMNPFIENLMEFLWYQTNFKLPFLANRSLLLQKIIIINEKINKCNMLIIEIVKK